CAEPAAGPGPPRPRAPCQDARAARGPKPGRVHRRRRRRPEVAGRRQPSAIPVRSTSWFRRLRLLRYAERRGLGMPVLRWLPGQRRLRSDPGDRVGDHVPHIRMVIHGIVLVTGAEIEDLHSPAVKGTTASEYL